MGGFKATHLFIIHTDNFPGLQVLASFASMKKSFLAASCGK